MSTKAAVEALAAALKRREDRFDVQFLGIVVGTATSWDTCEADDGSFFLLFNDFKREDKGLSGSIAVDFEAGVYYWFKEGEDNIIDINYDNAMSIVMTALGRV